MKIVNLIFLRKPDQILLAMKKRGFGVGKLNGVGGKVTPGETIEQAAIREAGEEIEVQIEEKDLKKVAEITFIFKEKEGWDILCHVYMVERWKGDPVETEEMAPQWYPLTSIPYSNMWIDDKYWLPIALEGKFVTATFNFLGDGSVLDSFSLEAKTI